MVMEAASQDSVEREIIFILAAQAICATANCCNLIAMDDADIALVAGAILTTT